MESGINSWIDYTVIGIYFIFVIVVGLMSMRRKNRESVTGYFLAGRTMHWLPIGASIFASNIGSEHFVGLAGSGAASGIAVTVFEWGSVLVLVMLGWVYLPIYLSAQLYTVPEYLGKRFGGYRLRIYLSCLSLVMCVITKVSVDVYAGGVFIQQATGWNLYLSMIPLLLVTAVYTMAGGLAAVVFTDTLQTVIMLTGAITLAGMAYVKVGGLEALYYKYPYAIPTSFMNATTSSFNTTCGLPSPDAFHIFRDPVTSDLPWPGIIMRATFIGLWYWCADQVIVQRALAARNLAHAQAATLVAGLLKFTPLFLMILPGMISRVLYPDMVACADATTCTEVCNNPSGCSNVAYPLLILKMSPTGMRGLLMSVMVAALMSSLTSIFNSAGTVFTMDIWRRIKPNASEKQLLLVGRIFVVVLVAISIAWIPLIVSYQEGQLFIYMQAVTGYLAPPISAIFILAVFVPRVNETGAFWAVLVGFALGVTRLILDFIYPKPGCGKADSRPAIVSKIHFAYFGMIVLTITGVLAVFISLLTPAQPAEEIKGLTWWSIQKNKKKTRQSTTGTKVDEYNQTASGLRSSSEKGNIVMIENLDSNVARGGNVKSPGGTTSLETFDLTVPAPWRHVLNTCAIALLCLLVFLMGLFY